MRGYRQGREDAARQVAVMWSAAEHNGQPVTVDDVVAVVLGGVVVTPYCRPVDDE